MRVAIVDSQVAFFHGGAEMLAARLADAMRARGHDVEMVRVPINPSRPGDIHHTIFRVLGVDPDLSFNDHSGRPIPAIDHGEVISELI